MMFETHFWSLSSLLLFFFYLFFLYIWGSRFFFFQFQFQFPFPFPFPFFSFFLSLSLFSLFSFVLFFLFFLSTRGGGPGCACLVLRYALKRLLLLNSSSRFFSYVSYAKPRALSLLSAFPPRAPVRSGASVRARRG
ncbi:hypothetical protein DFP73DRAFT_534851 [Morchella snyderi]|nr:hypothetical protein DFP73DRAFT_534851 [Morchella snyderi]